MSWSVNLGGKTFTEANVEGTAYADEQSGFPAILAAIAAESKYLKGLGTTSATTLTPSTGTVVLTTDQPVGVAALPVDALVQVISQSDSSVYMIGTVVSFAGTTLTLSVTLANGGQASDWVIGLPGQSFGDLVQDLVVNGYSITSRNNGNIQIQPHGGGGTIVNNLNATGTTFLVGPVRLVSGGQFNGLNLGGLSGTIGLAPNVTQFAYGTTSSNIILDCSPPNAGYGYTLLLKITQGGAGQHTVTVRRLTDQVEASWVGDPVDWSERASGDWNIISIFYAPTGDLLIGNLAAGG